jgi:hypothetical protein
VKLASNALEYVLCKVPNSGKNSIKLDRTFGRRDGTQRVGTEYAMA